VTERRFREERAALERWVLLQQAAESMAHRIRNPLAELRTRLQLMTRRSGSEEIREGLDESIRLLDRVARSSGELLQPEDEPAFRPEPLDLGELALEIAEAYRRRFERRKVGFRMELPDEPVPLVADRRALLLALECLLEGFLSLTEPGGGHRIEARCEQAGHGPDREIRFEIQGPCFLPLPEDERWRTYDPLLFDLRMSRAWPFSVAHYLLDRSGGRLRVRRCREGRVVLRTILGRPRTNDQDGAETGEER